MPTWVPYPDFVNPGDNAWQLTAATLVGLMSVPGLVVLYGGVMQKRWSVNSMMMAFVAFALVLIVWVLSGSRWPSAAPCTSSGPTPGSSAHMWGTPGSVLGTGAEQSAGSDPIDHAPGRRSISQTDAGLLPVRVRGDHADPDARIGARPDQLQGLDPVRDPLVEHRLHGQRLPDLGRRLVGGARRARLLGRVRHPPRGRRLRLRGGGGDRAAAPA